MTLSVEQIGAYNLILFAMWSRESCDLPDDDAQLSAVCRVSKTVWLRKFKPVLWPFFDVVGGVLVSDRLQKEAVFVEKYLQSQSSKKRGKTAAKSLKTNEPPKSSDESPDISGEKPTQQPNNPKEVDKSTSTQEAADFYLEYWGEHPKPVESPRGESLFSELVKDGEDPQQIIAAAKAYAAEVATWSADGKVQQSDNFLDPDRGQWRKYIPTAKAKPATDLEIAKANADRINAGAFVLPGSIPERILHLIESEGLVTTEILKERGIAA
jgi:uncharacterized protein YdaU (DUF1376 family)